MKAKSVCDYMQNGKGIVCVNVMNRLSVDCDCDSNPAEEGSTTWCEPVSDEDYGKLQ